MFAMMNTPKVGIVDIGIANIYSVFNAFKKINVDVKVIDKGFDSVDCLILPGVGNFGYASSVLQQEGIAEEIHKHNIRQKPIIGICLGMQLLFQESDEAPKKKGLALLNGRFNQLPSPKIHNRKNSPNIGYSFVEFKSKVGYEHASRFEKLKGYYYFLHSFALQEEINGCDVQANSVYNGQQFTSFFLHGNYCGIQFHPERSGRQGLELLSALMNILNRKV